MAKSLQVTVTNPDDLNTLQGELVTQNYNLEILGLKNPADFRKFSKSLMMLDRILKETNDKVDNGLNKKLNKGTYEGDADDLKREIDGKVSKSGDTMTGVLTVKAGGITISHDSNPALRVQSQDGRTYLGFFGYDNDNKNTSVSNEKANISLRLYDNGNAAIDANNLATNSKEVVTAINELNSNKINKDGDIMTGPLTVVNTGPNKVILQHGDSTLGSLFANEICLGIYNEQSDQYLRMNNDGSLKLGASNLITENKDVVEVINDCVNFTKSGGDYWYQGYSKSFEGLSVDEFLKHRKTGFFNSNKTSPGYYPYGRHDYQYYFVNSHSNSSGYAGIIAMDFYGESMGFKTIVDGRANKWNELAHFEDGNLKQCPFPVGFVICTTKKENPSAIWTGTVWHEIRDRFLYSSSTVEPANIGGSNSITLSVSQLPPHNHGIDYARRNGKDGNFDYGRSETVSPDDADYNESDTVGDGSPIDITPAFYSVKMWVRMA